MMSAIPAASSRPSGIPFFQNRLIIGCSKISREGSLYLLGQDDTEDYLVKSVSGAPGSYARVTDGPQGRWCASGIAVSSDGDFIIVGGMGDDAVVTLSSDSGVTWVEQETLGGAVVGWNVAISDDGSTLLAVDQSSEVWRSTDGGTTWDSTSLIGPGDPVQIIMNQSDPTVSMIFSTSNYYITADSGASWELVSSRELIDRFAATPSMEHIYCCSSQSGDLACSTDFGQTWEELGQFPGATLICSSDGDSVILFTYDEAIISHDYGHTWSLLPLPFPGMKGMQIFSGDGTLLKLVIVDSRGLSYVTTDGGISWSNLVLA